MRCLRRIREDSHPVELRGFDEVAQFLEIRFGFARKADDHAGTDRDAGNRPPDPFEKLEENIATGAALHALQHGSAGVLQRHVDIFDQRRVLRDGIQQPLGHLVRIAVEKTDPLGVIGLDLRQPRQ